MLLPRADKGQRSVLVSRLHPEPHARLMGAHRSGAEARVYYRRSPCRGAAARSEASARS